MEAGSEKFSEIQCQQLKIYTGFARDFLPNESTPGFTKGPLIRFPYNQGCPYMSAGVHLAGVAGSKVSGSGASLVALPSLGQVLKKFQIWCSWSGIPRSGCNTNSLY